MGPTWGAAPSYFLTRQTRRLPLGMVRVANFIPYRLLAMLAAALVIVADSNESPIFMLAHGYRGGRPGPPDRSGSGIPLSMRVISYSFITVAETIIITVSPHMSSFDSSCMWE